MIETKLNAEIDSYTGKCSTVNEFASFCITYIYIPKLSSTKIKIIRFV